MKTNSLNLPLLLLVLWCAAPPLFAQAPQAPGYPPGTTATPPKQLDVLNVSDLPLRLALTELLQQSLEKKGLPPLNIVFGPGTEDLPIASLVLRNVSGPDAVQLIATAAGCVAEPLTSTDDVMSVPGTPARQVFPGQTKPVIIGFMIRNQNAGRTMPPQFIPAPAGISFPGPNPAAPGKPAAKPRVTRVYPLGNIIANTKFPDLEKTLQDILKMDEVPADQVKLALHEKVNVLVVNAPESVHILVDQFLSVLERNSQAAAQQNALERMRAEREAAENAMKQQQAREQIERANAAAAQKRALQQEEQKRQDAAKKKPGEP